MSLTCWRSPDYRAIDPQVLLGVEQWNRDMASLSWMEPEPDQASDEAGGLSTSRT